MLTTLSAVRVVNLPGLVVSVHELSVAEVRAWLMEIEAGAHFDPFHAMLSHSFHLPDLARMSDASLAQLEAFTPSDLEPLISAARSLNPDFFRRDANGGETCRSDEIDRVCCALVARGHSSVWTYPWKTYLTAIKAAVDYDPQRRN